MELHASSEDYLEAILVLNQKKGNVRSADIARYMEYSRASVSYAVSVLKKGGFLLMDINGVLRLTHTGCKIATEIYDRHCFFSEQLIKIGVNPQQAEKDACRMKHAVSQESFEKLKQMIEKKDR